MGRLSIIILSLMSLIVIYQFETNITSQPYPVTTISIFIFGITMWFLNIMPAPITGILIMVLFTFFGILSFEEVVSGLGEPVIWLVISVLVLGAAVEETRLDKRIAYKSLALFGKSEKKVIVIFIVLGYILTFLIPNSMARLSMLLPISQGVIDSIISKNKENFSKALILTITFVPYITTVAIITGASGSIYAAGLFEATLDYQWGYLYWLLLISPITIFTLVILWISLNYWFPLKNTEKMNTKLFRTKLIGMGKIKKTEKKLIVIYLVLIFGWVTNEWHALSISMVSLIAMVILFLPGIEIIKWEEARKKVDWGVPILFAAGLAIALAFEAGGVIEFIAGNLLYRLENVQPLALSFSVMLVIIIIRIGFTNFNSMVASTMPLILALGIISEVNPVWLGMVYLMASSTSFFIPTQAIGSMTTYSLGYYTSTDFFKVGLPVTFAIIIVTLAAAFYYWPIMGLSILE